EVADAGAVDDLAVAIAAIRHADQEGAVGPEAGLDEVTEERPIVDARALQDADRQGEVEGAEVEGAEVGEVGLDEGEGGIGEPRAGDRQGRGAVIDADEGRAGAEARAEPADQRQLVAAADPEGEDAGALAGIDPLEGVLQVEDEARILEARDPREAARLAVA